ncbi:hypothetical protein [Falsiroseomonas sp. HW251]|uniref:hypothetical protein n=1 Tax=Falsiroseomonas sp. HW251 TaxID=3390998 RepID=UPI003D319D19
MRRLLVLLPLAACAAPPPAPDPNAWIGRQEGDLVATLGVPSRVYEAEGRRFLAYDVAGAPAPFLMPSIGIGGFRSSGGWGSASGIGTGLGLSFGSFGGASGPCTTTFEVRQGIVATAGRAGACG